MLSAASVFFLLPVNAFRTCSMMIQSRHTEIIGRETGFGFLTAYREQTLIVAYSQCMKRPQLTITYYAAAIGIYLEQKLD